MRPQNLKDFANTSLAQDGSRHTLLCREKGASELQGYFVPQSSELA